MLFVKLLAAKLDSKTNQIQSNMEQKDMHKNKLLAAKSTADTFIFLYVSMDDLNSAESAI
jgi:hypothetical protein